MTVGRNLVLAAAAVLFAAGAWATEGWDTAAYAGSEACRECHGEKYDGWRQTFHATVVQNAKMVPEAVLGDFSVPGLGFTRADVEFTIGGHWDQRYMKKIGDAYFVLPRLWSVQSEKWRPYNVWSWRKKPYSRYCKGCHVTAYDPKANVPTAENRIGCEACHGPGWAHVQSRGEAPIVNPSKLSAERSEMVCAACHVRGTDPSGTYFFPVGYQPGEDLAQYYTPLDRKEEETPRQAILRGFRKWKEERSGNAKVKCDVCGIYGADSEDQKKAEGTLDFCFGCHDFKERYTDHTHHGPGVDLVCFDCHVQQTRGVMQDDKVKSDVHSYGFFLVHPDNCYDRRIERTCKGCHEARGEAWARRMVNRWRNPVELDH